MKKSILVCIFTLVLTVLMATELTSSILAAEGLGCGEGFGPIAEFLCGISSNPETGGAVVGERLNSLLSGILGFLTIVASLYFAFQFIMAGFQYISAGGDKAKTEEAQKKITNSLIGIILVVGAWVILGVIGAMLGLKILDPGAVLQTIGM